MGGHVVSLAPEMTPYESAAGSGYEGTMPVEMNQGIRVRQRRVLGEDRPDVMQSALPFAMNGNEDEPEDDEDNEDEDSWDDDPEPEAMPHGILSR